MNFLANVFLNQVLTEVCVRCFVGVYCVTTVCVCVTMVFVWSQLLGGREEM